MMKTFKTMMKIELKLSLRGMDMLLFAICMPVVVLVILGMLYGDKPAFAGADYTFLEQSFGALATISICAGGVMGLPLVVSDYRDKRILKRFQVTPVSPLLILSIQVAIYTLYALVSLLLIYLCAVIFFDCHFQGSLPKFLAYYLLVTLSMFSIGIMVGGIAPNTKTAGVWASVLYFPMLVFSGRYAALRNHADSLAKSSQPDAADPGHQTAQKRLFRLACGKCLDPLPLHVCRSAGLHRCFTEIFQVGIK